eukprot:gnl/TRDRNA2_/TRDRNA2_176096_c12_seq25.p1 gnl/TRDRNA2_/TRDRNA2_176096_c12~~gnl/TRDRNA2_/TRDRNA2_176096_c12_seq25.p1  ORF type:complete len:724 (+),score=221.38 gnl/TRDRNA2_/TRDRNA2_176096_c12_seq25:107-2278(+)
MARMLILACFLLAGVSHATGNADKVTPVEKVIELLKKLSAQTAEEGKEEAKQYDEFACFCKEQAELKTAQIEKSNAKIEHLNAKIKQLDGERQVLDSDIGDLSTEISKIEEEIKKVSDQMGLDQENYAIEAKDIEDAISAIVRAADAIRNSKKNLKGDSKPHLAELKATVAHMLKDISNASLLEEESHALDMLAEHHDPGVVYDLKANDIINGFLRPLERTFRKNKAQRDTEWFQTKHSYETKLLGLANKKHFAELEKRQKSALRESLVAELQAAKEEVAEESTAKSADDEFRKALTDRCETKSKDFDQRSSTRADELKALSEATEVLEKGAKPNYGANAKLAEFMQQSGHWLWLGRSTDTSVDSAASQQPLLLDHASTPAKPASFIQLGGINSRSAQATQKALNMLQSAAASIHSPLLSILAVKVQLGADHYVKVRGLIRDLIETLKKAAEAEAQSKGFCDKHILQATGTRDDATMAIEEKAADIKKGQAKMAQLLDDIRDLDQAVAGNKKATLETTELWAKEKAGIALTLEMATQGKTSVEFALGLLSQFYGISVNYGLVEIGYVPPKSDREGKTVEDYTPESFSGEYKGKHSSAKGIMGLLEVIHSDFQRTIDAMQKADEQKQADVDAFQAKIEADNKAKSAERAKKDAEVSVIKDEIVTLMDNKKDAEKKLDTALEELQKLTSMCVNGEETFAQRKQKREQEIKALREALQILIEWQGV